MDYDTYFFISALRGRMDNCTVCCLADYTGAMRMAYLMSKALPDHRIQVLFMARVRATVVDGEFDINERSLEDYYTDVTPSQRTAWNCFEQDMTFLKKSMEVEDERS
jgi:hypothetical protein